MIVQRRQAREDRSGVGRHGEGRRVEASERRDMLDAGRLQDDVGRPLHHRLGPFQRGARRQLQHGDQVALVLLRNEPGRRAGELHAGDADQRGIDDQHHRQPAHQSSGDAAVTVGQPVKAAVETREGRRPGSGRARPARACLVRIVRLEQQRAQRRAKRQRHEAGDHRRGGDGHGELAEELAGNAGQEGRRHEHRAQRQRDRHQRAADLIHRPMRRLRRRHACPDIALDILHHDDRVIDDDADCQHKAEQRQVVERNAQRVQHREGADQRNRDGNDRNDRGAPGLQEQEYHADDQQDGDEDRRHHLMHRLSNEDGRIVDDDVIDAWRKILLQALHGVEHLVLDLQRIGAGLGEDQQRQAVACGP